MRPRLGGALLVAALAVAAVCGALAAPVGAHDETASFTATRAEPNPDGSYTIDVLLTYDNDGHGVEDAQVAITVQGPDGTSNPVISTPGERAGAYTARVMFAEPGRYSVTATSESPAATTTFPVTVPEPATTTTTEATATEATTTVEATTTTEADETDTASNVASVVANTALLAAGAAAAWLGLRWWRRRGDGASS